MRLLITFFLITTAALAQNTTPQLTADDAVRIREFYRLAAQIQNQIWPDWSRTPAPLLLVTPDTEFLTHHAEPPKGFEKAGDDLYARPRQFPTNLLATFPAFGPPSVIVIGEPRNTTSKTSTPWLVTLMHEHFHQLQNAQPRLLPSGARPRAKPWRQHRYVDVELPISVRKARDSGILRISS